MTRRPTDSDASFDRLVEDLRSDRLPDRQAREITDRVWSRLSAAGAPLRGCDDVREAIPELVAGRLSEARARLVEDHTRSCVPCRRALLEARGVLPAASETAATTAGRSARRIPGWLRIAAVALVAIGAGVLSIQMIGDLAADRALHAQVVTVDGTLQRIGAPDGAERLSAGDVIDSRQPVRTSKNGGAVLRLDDGSLVELAPRSEITLRGARRGTTIELDRGNIIVDAADQGRDHLFVRTDDCRVAVKGTVFAVDHGLKGSRVAVVEGEVEVRQVGTRTMLLPGDQVTTNDRLAATSVAEQVAWSRDAESHLALLAELTRLGRDLRTAIHEATPQRSSSRLLALVPDDTVAYISIPNLTEGLRSARDVLDARLADNATLAAWWRDSVVSAGIDRDVDALFDRLEPLGRALGDEIVASVPATAFDGAGEPLVLALVDDPAGFRAALDAELARLASDTGSTPLAIVDDPTDPTPDADVLLWLHDGLLAAASDREALIGVARRLDGTPSGFTAGRLHARLEEAYARGVSWLVGIDLAAVLDDVAASDSDSVLSDLGLLDADVLVVEQRRVAGHTATDAALTFDGPRRGVAAWLASPAPIGGLELVSADASMAVGMVTRDAVEMLDDILGLAGAEAAAGLAEIRDSVGIDVRRDLAAALGGEAVVAMDGPLLPTPSWKLVLEVYDPATFERTLQIALDHADAELAAADLPVIRRSAVDAAGARIHSLSHPRLPMGVAWTVSDGYAVFAPSVALVERSLLARSSGGSLAGSGRLSGLLPANGFTDCSLLVYQNFGPIAEALPDAAVSELPPAALDLLRRGTEPGVLCAYGLDDRILLAAEGGNPFGFEAFAGLLPMLGGDAHDPVSSGR